MVLNNPPLPPGDVNGGPCYRCVFPKPPPPESVVSCGDGGILGPVVGVMGILQALEAIKLVTQPPWSPSVPVDPPSLLIFSAYSSPIFRSIRLRSRKAKCVACSAQATVSAQALQSGSLDYVQFCGSVGAVNALAPQERVAPDNFARLRSGFNPFTGTSNKDSHILVDTREQVQFELGNIDGSINIPFSKIETTAPHTLDIEDHDMEREEDWTETLRRTEKPIFVVCRRGNDSQLSVQKMKELGLSNGGQRLIAEIRGGLEAWRKSVDPDFPDY